MINADRLLAWHFPEVTCRYTRDDAMLYALATGVGADPTDEAQLRFVDDTGPEPTLALPTMAVVLGFPGSWMDDPATGIDFARIVHGEEEILMHRPLAAEGTLIARHRVTDVIDKGEGRGALVTYDKELYDSADGEIVATVRHTTFARGNGGFSRGASAPRMSSPRPAPTPMPDRSPDHSRAVPSVPQQALLYRLCADRNPLHSNPGVARKAGFDRPILHGLCSFGMAGFAIVADWCGHDPAMLASLGVRFSSPVYPGETLVVESYERPDSILFQARVKERDVIVLSNGRATRR